MDVPEWSTDEGMPGEVALNEEKGDCEGQFEPYQQIQCESREC